MDRTELVNFVMAWTKTERRGNVIEQKEFAKFYADTWPEGDHELTPAWEHWVKYARVIH